MIVPIARLRTLKEAYVEIKTLDPMTSVSRNYVRQLMITKTVPIVMVGRRRLVNMDGLLEYLNGCATIAEDKPEVYGRIRKVV